MYRIPGCSWVPGTAPYRTHRRPEGQADRLGRERLGFVVLARYVFDGLAWTSTRTSAPGSIWRARATARRWCSRRAAAQWGGASAGGVRSDIEGPAGAALYHPTPEELKRVLAKYPFIKPITRLRAVKGPERAGRGARLLVSRARAAGAADEAAYKLARALHKGEAALRREARAGKESTLANTLAAARGRT